MALVGTIKEEHELPDEVLNAIEEGGKAVSGATRDALAIALLKSREEAVNHRKTAGYDDTWTLCEEQYIGIDDANRNEFRDGKWIKPTVMNAPITLAGATNGAGNRSSAFVRLTSRYVDAADAKVGEILIPIDGKAFAFTATPNPDLIAGKKDTTQVTKDGQPLYRDARPEEMPRPAPILFPTQQQTAEGQAPPPQTPQTNPQPLTTKDLAMEAIDQANEQAKKAETRIFDWMVECQYPREMRKVIADCARLGVGVLKGPFPDRKRQFAFKNGKVVVNNEIVPVVEHRSPWAIYPDPACGESIQNGDYVWEKDYGSRKQVRAMKTLPGYIPSEIDKVLEEGPGQHKTDDTGNPNEKDRHSKKHQFEIWYFHGVIAREHLEATNAEAAKGLDKEVKDAFAIVTMINDRVVHATLNPLDMSGSLPYLNIPWQRREGEWAGIGVAEQIRVPQRIVNAATRSMLNNAGVASGAQIIIDQVSVKPADNRWEITPNKIWYKNADGTMDDVKKAFATFNIETRVSELMEIIEYGMRLAEESTSIPLITQGQSGKTTPDTYGAAQLQDNNANQLLRRIGYSFDDYITERLIRMFYEYLLLDEKVPDDEKGDWKINARGSSAMVERSIREQTIAQMTSIAENPIFGVDPKKWFKQLVKSKRMDPADFQYTPEEQEKIDNAPKEPPPAVQVAQIKAQIEQMKIQAAQQNAQIEAQMEKELAQLVNETKVTVENMRNETARLKVKMDTDRDTIYVEAQTKKITTDYEGKMREIEAKKELLAMELAANQQITVEQAKVKLADTTMKLQVQRELAQADMALDMHKDSQKNRMESMRSAAEVPGKASPGKGFTQ